MTPLRSLLALWGRHPARWLFPLLILPGVAIVVSRPPAWRGNWMWTLDWMGAAVILSGPLAAGLGAWRAWATRRSFAPYLDAARTGGRLGLVEIGGVALWAGLGHLVGVAVALTMTATAGPAGLPPLWMLLPHLLLLGAWTAVGWIVGSLLPSIAVAPVVAVLAYGVEVAGLLGHLPVDLVIVGGATAPLVGVQPNPVLLALQCLVWSAVIVVGISLRRSTSRRVVDVPLALGAASGVLLLGAVAVAVSGLPRYVPVSQELVCQGESPRVCGFEVSAPQLDAATEIFTTLTRTAEQLGVRTPDAYQQVSSAPLADPSPRSFLLPSDTPAPADLVRYVVHDDRCLQGDTPVDSTAFSAVDGVGGALLVQAGYATPESLASPEADRILALAPDARREFMNAALDAAAACRYDDVPAIP